MKLLLAGCMVVAAVSPALAWEIGSFRSGMTFSEFNEAALKAGFTYREQDAYGSLLRGTPPITEYAYTVQFCDGKLGWISSTTTPTVPNIIGYLEMLAGDGKVAIASTIRMMAQDGRVETAKLAFTAGSDVIELMLNSYAGSHNLQIVHSASSYCKQGARRSSR